MNHITYYYVHRRICFRLYTDFTNVGRRQRREKTIFFSRPAVSVCARLCVYVCVVFDEYYMLRVLVAGQKAVFLQPLPPVHNMS